MFALKAVSGLAIGSVAWFSIFADAPAGTMYIGELHDASATEVVVSMSTELVTFVVTSSTKVTLDGKPVEVTELRPGDQASVTAGAGDGRFPIAIDVSARRNIVADSPPETDLRR